VYIGGPMRHVGRVITLAVMNDEPRLPLSSRFVQRLSDGRWLALDVVLAGLFAFSAIAVAASTLDFRLSGSAWEVARVALIVVAAAALPFRRRYPSPALAVILPAVALALALQVEQPLVAVAALALYSVTLASSQRTSRVALGLVTVVTMAAAVIAGGKGVGVIVVADLAGVVGAWLVAENRRGQQVSAAAAVERAAEREAARDERAMRAVADERLAIARELHDIVAHAMSVIAVRSGVARVVMDDRPAEARDALAAIETTSRQALQEMRLLVGVLRRGETETELSPAPGLDRLQELVSQASNAGVDVAVQIDGDRWPLPSGIDLSAYRIIQEALTNVVRHVGPTQARVRVAYSADAIVVEVIDDGGRRWDPPLVDPASDGHGLIGMRERVALYGGELTAGPHGHGFQVRATLPTLSIDEADV
jgi:signal transduction histidine kinase